MIALMSGKEENKPKKNEEKLGRQYYFYYLCTGTSHKNEKIESNRSPKDAKGRRLGGNEEQSH